MRIRDTSIILAVTVLIAGILARNWLADMAERLIAFLAPFAALVMVVTILLVVVVAFAVALRIADWLLDMMAESRHDRAMKAIELQRAEREANIWETVAPAGSIIIRHTTNEYERGVVSQPLHLAPGPVNGHPSAFTEDAMQRWLIYSLANAQARGGGGAKALPSGAKQAQLMAPLMSVIEVIKDETCCAFYGGRDAGKTTTALHWLAHKRTENYVIDPKPLGLNPWPNAKVLGANGKFEEVEPSIVRLYNELLHRQAESLLNEQPITLLVDELYTLVHVHQLEIMKMIFAIISLGREYGVNASFTSSAKGVKSLGIEGMSGLADALTFVHLVKVGDERKAYVDLGGGEFECLPCGPYIPPVQTRQIPRTVAMTEEERIAEMVKAGATNYAIAQEIWGSRNDKRYALIDAVRAAL